MNVNECVLIEFPNQNHTLAVGYYDWLQVDEKKIFEDLSKEDLGLEYEIRWPYNKRTQKEFEFFSIEKLKKGSKNIEYKNEAVKLLNFGGKTHC